MHQKLEYNKELNTNEIDSSKYSYNSSNISNQSTLCEEHIMNLACNEGIQ